MSRGAAPRACSAIQRASVISCDRQVVGQRGAQALGLVAGGRSGPRATARSRRGAGAGTSSRAAHVSHHVATRHVEAAGRAPRPARAPAPRPGRGSASRGRRARGPAPARRSMPCRPSWRACSTTTPTPPESCRSLTRKQTLTPARRPRGARPGGAPRLTARRRAARPARPRAARGCSRAGAPSGGGRRGRSRSPGRARPAGPPRGPKAAQQVGGDRVLARGDRRQPDRGGAVADDELRAVERDLAGDDGVGGQQAAQLLERALAPHRLVVRVLQRPEGVVGHAQHDGRAGSAPARSAR